MPPHISADLTTHHAFHPSNFCTESTDTFIFFFPIRFLSIRSVPFHLHLPLCRRYAVGDAEAEYWHARLLGNLALNLLVDLFLLLLPLGLFLLFLLFPILLF